jgi:hypothetical protein
LVGTILPVLPLVIFKTSALALGVDMGKFLKNETPRPRLKNYPKKPGVKTLFEAEML